MAEEQHQEAGGNHSGVSPNVLNVLEMLDNIAHVVVAVFFILLACSVLVYASLLLVRDVPLIVQPSHAAAASEQADFGGAAHTARDITNSAPRDSGASGPGESGRAAEHGEARSVESLANPFLHRSLELLSTLLFVVIVLELLKTIITYLKTHNIQAIMKEFLVVGIISSIRKILLVGAESSLGSSDPTAAYIKEASGTVITIAGILLLIAGLIFLQRSENGRWTVAGNSPEP